MKLSSYRGEIRSRKALLRRIESLNTHIPFMIGSQFSCLPTPEIQFQIVMDNFMLYQKAKCYKGKEILIKDDEDAPPTRYVKAHPEKLFKHELKAIKQKIEHKSLDW